MEFEHLDRTEIELRRPGRERVIRRLGIYLGAIAMGLLLGPVSQAAGVVHVSTGQPVAIFAHDRPHVSTVDVAGTLEQEHPISQPDVRLHRADVRRAFDASAWPGFGIVYAYDARADLAATDSVTTFDRADDTSGSAVVAATDLSIQRGFVAAKTGIAANQAAGNAARDVLAAAHPGSLIDQSFGTGLGARRLDVLTQTGIGIESKVGRTSLTATTRAQIAKDQWLLANNPDVTGIQWVFSRSGVTGQVGPTGPLADALGKAGVPWSLAP